LSKPSLQLSKLSLLYVLFFGSLTIFVEHRILTVRANRIRLGRVRDTRANSIRPYDGIGRPNRKNSPSTTAQPRRH
jgi:hypothetical protein